MTKSYQCNFYKEEPDITINGTTISLGMSMTVRVAIESFASDLNHNGLGDDELGVDMTKGYLANIAKIRELIFKKACCHTE